MADQTAEGDNFEKEAKKKLTGWRIFGSKYSGSLDHTAEGDNFEKEAEKKLTGWQIFGSKYEDAAELYYKSALCFMIGQNWDRAGAVFIKLANCELELGSKIEAASAYVDAANCYKKISFQDAVQSLEQAVNLFLDIGRLHMAARYCKELGELCEQEQNIEKATDYFGRGADYFQSQDMTSPANMCKQKVAQFAAQMGDYTKAVEIFEAIARQSMNNPMLKYGAKWVLFDALICKLCRGDVITNSLELYQEIDHNFSAAYEYKLLVKIAAAMDEKDAGKFTKCLKKYDKLTKKDTWKFTILLKKWKMISSDPK